MEPAYIILPSEGLVRWTGKALRFTTEVPDDLAQYLRGEVHLPETSEVQTDKEGRPISIATVARGPKCIESSDELFDALKLLSEQWGGEVAAVIPVEHSPGALRWIP